MLHSDMGLKKGALQRDKPSRLCLRFLLSSNLSDISSSLKNVWVHTSIQCSWRAPVKIASYHGSICSAALIVVRKKNEVTFELCYKDCLLPRPRALPPRALLFLLDLSPQSSSLPSSSETPPYSAAAVLFRLGAARLPICPLA